MSRPQEDIDAMRALSHKDLREKKGIPYTDRHVNRMVKAGEFPAPFPLGPGRKAFDEDEVDEWLERRKALRDVAVAVAELQQPEPVAETPAPKSKPKKGSRKPKKKPGRTRPRRVIKLAEVADERAP
jgi:prophage regulatory protein